ncbi:sodium-independent sulfate anion transporter isoform X2 [Diorhabda sublineata]|uniref:sodium-independent sulfate anion transporter isoform X2 n=1 Tax=Diorhabda sublineata TaxID=1163346 RepID=UPI0024E12F7C|nr:sodium-independent sulfate anion transporter isoform X2 [Diorhabda sublineata]
MIKEMDNVVNQSLLRDYRTSGTTNIRRLIKRRFPLLAWLPSYNFQTFSQDFLAGITVALTEIPQGIAYAIVAGLPSQYGLYAGFMGCFMYFMLGSCKDINIGPTAIMALMIQPYVSSMGIAGGILITFLSGCLIFLCGLLHLGFIVEFFSYPVIAGFTTAAAFNIASSQIKSLLGIPGKSDTFLTAWISVFENIKKTRLADTLMGFFVIVFLVIAKEIRRYGSLKQRPEWTRKRYIIGVIIFMFSLASNAIAVMCCSVVAYIFKQYGQMPFKLTGEVRGGLPSFTLPPFSTNFNGTEFRFEDMMTEYGTVVIFCPLIAVLEHIAIAKAFSKGKSLDATQEMIALGVCNIMGSFVQSMPVTGSFTRTAVNNASGAKTPACSIITGIMVLVALGFLTSTFQYIPKSTLAGVIMVAMYYLCDFQAFILLWKSKKLDLIPLTATLVCCLFINLEYGILIGLAVNIVFVLYSSARPKIEIEEISPLYYLVKFKSGLHYTSAEYLREYILSMCTSPNSTVIIDGEYIGNIDATVAKSLNGLKDELQIRNQNIIFWNFKKTVINTCLGVNSDLGLNVKEESLEQIIAS